MSQFTNETQRENIRCFVSALASIKETTAVRILACMNVTFHEWDGKNILGWWKIWDPHCVQEKWSMCVVGIEMINDQWPWCAESKDCMTQSRAFVLQHRVSMCVSCCAIIGIGNGFASQGSQIVWVYCTMRVILLGQGHRFECNLHDSVNYFCLVLLWVIDGKIDLPSKFCHFLGFGLRVRW